jgi:predicted amidohydrolase
VHHADELHELGHRAARITERGSIPVAFASAAGYAGPTHPDAAGHSAIWAADGTILAGTTATPGHTAQTVLRP